MRRTVLVGGVTVAVLALVGGYAVADAEDVVPGVLTLSRATSGPPPSSGAPGSPASSDSAWPAVGALADVLGSPGRSAPTPTTLGLARALRSDVHRLGPAVSLDVVDVETGAHLYASKSTTVRAPASTAKLLTAASVLSALGPDTRLTTRVVQPSDGEVVLVGGGDRQLASGKGLASAVFGHAGLGDLARTTAAALKAAGHTRVKVGVDDSVFTGPRLSPHWARADSATGVVGPVSALGLAAQAPEPGRAAPADPSMGAGKAFVAALVTDGIHVTGGATRVRAPEGASELASVQSATVAQLLTVTLATSDNTEAEALARLGARASGHTGSFAGVAAENVARAKALGAWTQGIRIYDGSGLARADRIPPRTLTTLLAKVAASSSPRLRALFATLPIAGFTGTLAERFHSRAELFGAGVVRAKTGTLSGVNSLAGVTVDRDGRLLAFAVLANRLTHGADVARAELDALASTLARCGCH